MLTVSRPELTAKTLTDVLSFRETRQFAALEGGQEPIRVFETGEGGTGAEIHLETRNDLQRERPGRGSVHHVAFRVENDEEMHKWWNG